MEWIAVLGAVFAIFLPALVLPGPDFIGVVRSSMVHGTRAGLLTSLGVASCLGLYATLSLLGLSAILVEYQMLAFAVRVGGGLYLAWLGARLLFSRPDPLEIDTADRRSGHSPFTFGFTVTLTNPKAVVLFTSVFATSVTPDMPVWVMVAMVALVVASAASWYTLVTLFISSPPVLRRFSRARHAIERIAGACFVGIGGLILADSRTPLSPS